MSFHPNPNPSPIVRLLLFPLLLFAVFGATPLVRAAPPPVLVGAVTPNSAEIRTLLAAPAPGLRLAVVPEGGARRVLSPDWLGLPAMPVARFVLADLPENTVVRYALLAADGEITGTDGRFRTFPARPTSFSFAVGSCWQDMPGAYPVFDAIAAHDPLLFIQHGDLHYSNFVTSVPDPYRAVYRQTFSLPTFNALLRRTAFAYMWDDHDLGPNDADRTSPSVPSVRNAYREHFPHYPLAEPAGGSAYHAFSVGRARFILTDCRSDRDPGNKPDGPGKSMLGTAQKAWLKRELLAARDRGDAPVFWVSTVPFLAPARKNGDDWGAYATERTELADFIKAEKISGVIVICGDAHMIAADDGRGADYATGGGAPLPVFHCGPLSARHSFKGGPKYSHGAYLPPFGQGSFGLFTVEDSGQSGAPVTVRYSGRRQDNLEILSCTVTVPTSR